MKMEYMDIVSWGDKVIGRATREEIYKKLRSHRIVHVLVFDEKGRLALQKRSRNVEFCPNCWSTAVGGHVQSGETYEQAAEREYLEELGGKTKLEFFSKDFYSDSRKINKFVVAFSTVNSGPFNLEKESVEKVDFFSIREIQKMIDRKEKFHPELLFLLEKYFGIGKKE